MLHLKCPAGQEILDALFDTGNDFDSVIPSLETYFMPKKNLIYECLSVGWDSAETVDAYVRCLQLLANLVTIAAFKRKL